MPTLKKAAHTVYTRDSPRVGVRCWLFLSLQDGRVMGRGELLARIQKAGTRVSHLRFCFSADLEHEGDAVVAREWERQV